MSLNIAVGKGTCGLFTALSDSLRKRRPGIRLVTGAPVVLVTTGLVTKCSTVVTSHEGSVTNVIANTVTREAADWPASPRKATLVSVVTRHHLDSGLHAT